MIEQFRADVHEGLSKKQKTLPSKYFYDKRGDELFIEIMQLPEYYLSRAELEIFQTQSNEIIQKLQIEIEEYVELIELGAGDGLKTKKLLQLLEKKKYNFSYCPIDISQNALNNLEKTLIKELPGIVIKKKQGDYFQVLEPLKGTKHPKVVLFLGSNIGNMTDEEATELIYKLGSNLNSNDKLILGVDLIKPASVVLPAYNDSKGITKEFNLNLLKRINHDLGGDFDINNFTHQPEYEEKIGIAKSYLVSSVEQNVSIKKTDKTYRFAKGEKVLTEISRKYNDEIITTIIGKTDFRIIDKLSDSKKHFANYILIRD
jgi:L-histidine Nalpha-methyltransferase